MNIDRNWVHEEAPQGIPSAAAYRLGCRCRECKAANSAYMAAYRANRVAQVEKADGTTEYHSHVGQPSKRTAHAHLCIHERCLDMAGLMILNGAVVDKTTCIVDPTFGAVAAAPTVSVEDALAALRKKFAA